MATYLIPFDADEKFTWENGEEEHVVPLIKKYLRTENQRIQLAALDITIEDCLNGRVNGEVFHSIVADMFEDWNTKLGYEHFGY